MNPNGCRAHVDQHKKNTSSKEIRTEQGIQETRKLPSERRNRLSSLTQQKKKKEVKDIGTNIATRTLFSPPFLPPLHVF